MTKSVSSPIVSPLPQKTAWEINKQKIKYAVRHFQNILGKQINTSVEIEVSFDSFMTFENFDLSHVLKSLAM